MKNVNENKQETDSIIFERLIKSGCIIPKWLQQSLEQNNKELFDVEKYEDLLNVNIFKNSNSISDFKKIDIHLTSKQYADFCAVKGLGEELLSCSLRCKYGWGIPTHESIEKIVNLMKINKNIDGLIEVGAGSGIWSKLIQGKIDKEVIACDLGLRNGDTPFPKFFDVLNIDAIELIKMKQNYAVLLVWCDTNHVGINVAKNLKSNNQLVLIGPVNVTGTDEFYKYLDENFDIVSTFNAASFSGVVNEGYVLKKLDKPKEYCDYLFTSKRENMKVKLFKKQLI